MTDMIEKVAASLSLEAASRRSRKLLNSDQYVVERFEDGVWKVVFSSADPGDCTEALWDMSARAAIKAHTEGLMDVPDERLEARIQAWEDAADGMNAIMGHYMQIIKDNGELVKALKDAATALDVTLSLSGAMEFLGQGYGAIAEQITDIQAMLSAQDAALKEEEKT